MWVTTGEARSGRRYHIIEINLISRSCLPANGPKMCLPKPSDPIKMDVSRLDWFARLSPVLIRRSHFPTIYYVGP
jgi:hypothetical protein